MMPTEFASKVAKPCGLQAEQLPIVLARSAGRNEFDRHHFLINALCFMRYTLITPMRH